MKIISKYIRSPQVVTWRAALYSPAGPPRLFSSTQEGKQRDFSSSRTREDSSDKISGQNRGWLSRAFKSDATARKGRNRCLICNNVISISVILLWNPTHHQLLHSERIPDSSRRMIWVQCVQVGSNLRIYKLERVLACVKHLECLIISKFLVEAIVNWSMYPSLLGLQLQGLLGLWIAAIDLLFV